MTYGHHKALRQGEIRQNLYRYTMLRVKAAIYGMERFDLYCDVTIPRVIAGQIVDACQEDGWIVQTSPEQQCSRRQVVTIRLTVPEPEDPIA